MANSAEAPNFNIKEVAQGKWVPEYQVPELAPYWVFDWTKVEDSFRQAQRSLSLLLNPEQKWQPEAFIKHVLSLAGPISEGIPGFSMIFHSPLQPAVEGRRSFWDRLFREIPTDSVLINTVLNPTLLDTDQLKSNFSDQACFIPKKFPPFLAPKEMLSDLSSSRYRIDCVEIRFFRFYSGSRPWVGSSYDPSRLELIVPMNDLTDEVEDKMEQRDWYSGDYVQQSKEVQRLCSEISERLRELEAGARRLDQLSLEGEKYRQRQDRDRALLQKFRVMPNLFQGENSSR